MEMFLWILDIAGTLAFAVSGAVRGVRHNLDILGVTVLAIVTGVFGGIVRDVLIGQTPPACFQNELYLIICITGSIVVLSRAESIARRSEKQWSVVQIFDAIGLGIFSAIGAAKAISAGFGVVGIIMMGMITSCGGGIIRDVLVREIPLVLRRDFYATASIIGVIFMLLAKKAGFNEYGQILSATIVASGLRFWAMATHLQLPQKIGGK
ncbi:MAG: trimeric intracellular cation channel family protein [Chitinispirillales bacterium]|jgi:uncharacterized membrane protein YeiH|nr:trimeric intracellular cation channel family protein [Chitinispirillales bacterium]